MICVTVGFYRPILKPPVIGCMDFILKVLRWFEVISFCLANLFVGIFFWKFLFNASIIPFLIAGGVSICVLKIQWLFLVVDRNREKEVSSAPMNWGAVTKVKKLYQFLTDFPLKAIPIVFKQFVINTIYETFPVFLIWLGVFGLYYLVENLTGSLNYSPGAYFFEIVASFGILLGVFQYYLQRHDERIATKIALFSKRISAMMDEELSFEKFYSSLPDNNSTRARDDGYEVKRWIDRKVDPRMHFVETLKLLAGDKDGRISFRSMIRDSRNNMVLNFPVSYANSDSKIDELEIYALGSPMRSKLFKAYNSFFEDEQRVDEIINKIKAEIDMQEFGNLCLGNINIMQEIFPQLINRKLRNAVENLCFLKERADGGEADCINKEEEFLSFRKRREILEGKITQKLMNEILD